jgi:hypothetical protein
MYSFTFRRSLEKLLDLCQIRDIIKEGTHLFHRMENTELHENEEAIEGRYQS